MQETVHPSWIHLSEKPNIISTKLKKHLKIDCVHLLMEKESKLYLVPTLVCRMLRKTIISVLYYFKMKQKQNLNAIRI